MRVDEPGEVQRLRREVMLLQGCCLGATLDAAGLERSDGRRALQPKQHTEALAHIDHDVGRSLRLKHDASSMPVKILDVVRENNSGDLPTRRQRNFERVALRVTGDRARDDEARLQVVGARREDQGGTTTALLVTSLRIKR